MPDHSVPREQQALRTIEHLREPFRSAWTRTSSNANLPYQLLGGEGLERLCFDLLLADGLTPRFFGTPGQAQYGIDLIVADGLQCTVYQCKNLSQFDLRTFERALTVFADSWISTHHELPKARSVRSLLSYRAARSTAERTVAGAGGELLPSARRRGRNVAPRHLGSTSARSARHCRRRFLFRSRGSFLPA